MNKFPCKYFNTETGENRVFQHQTGEKQFADDGWAYLVLDWAKCSIRPE
jgi:hypothetical protein